MKRLLIVLTALALIVAACGGDDALSEGEQAMVSVIVDEAMAQPDPDNPLSADREAATCFAEGLVGEMGVERLAAIGFATESADSQAAFAAMSAAELDQVADLALGCIDVKGGLVDQMVADGLSADSAECFADEIGKTDFYKDAFIAGMSGQQFDVSTNPEMAGAFLEAATECLTPEEMGALFGG